jgi:hypothetical protein
MISHVDYESGNGASIVIDDINSGSRKLVARTKCFNYQQGSLATWVDDECIVFNDFEDHKPCTKIISKSGELLRKLPFHFYSISSCNTFFTSINFHRYGIGLNGYGYNVSYNAEVVEDSLNKIPEP